MKGLSQKEAVRIKKYIEIQKNPVLWAKAFLRTVNNATKKIEPWTARWYQAEMLLDPSEKKVARCGRRTGKTETMCVEAIYDSCTKRSFRTLFAAPYESQIRTIFGRITELINMSPAVSKEVVSNTKTPFEIKFSNGSSIKGFTSGANSGNAGATMRGQGADAIKIDESDYMNDADFDAILAIAGEREGIKILLSSTPTGARKRFYQCCTDPKMHFKEFHYPSMCNPQWSPKMEEEFRASLSEQGYIHEILAEFGSQEAGVFNKEKLDKAMKVEIYAYNPLTYTQQYRVEQNHWDVAMLIPPEYIGAGVYLPTVFRTMGVDWDKYGASSSILILDYLPESNRFKVIRRIEVPKAEYSFDKAVNMIISLNKIYDPKFIYCDRGSGEYQIEMLHKYGDQHPETGLKNKVKGFQFSQKLEVMDPVTKIMDKKPMKPFMVNQLATCIEREQLILSPFDETLHKQLVDYEVIRQSANGMPVYTDVNEHFVDALGLAFLAFVLEYPDLTKTIESIDFTTYSTSMDSPMSRGIKKTIQSIEGGFGVDNPWQNLKNGTVSYEESKDECDFDQPKYFPVSASAFRPNRYSKWGSRAGGLITRRQF